jgi:cytochrome oxidase assembly protein ShyY1
VLKTALKPRWIAALVLAFVISTVFVLLSQWQFSQSQDAPPPPPAATEQVRPLTETFRPGEPLLAATADQMVTFTGSFDPERQVLVRNRLSDGRSGYWVVNAFTVDGAQLPPASGTAPAGVVIPVARGWIAEPGQADTAPGGQATVTGRLLPTEAPIAEPRVDGQVASLSVAELINLWDTPSYAAFVAAFSIDVGGTEVGAGTAASALEPIEVGPQPQETPVNWMNVFYAVEWVVFAGFAFFLWWRLVADDHRRTLEAREDAEAEARASQPANEHQPAHESKTENSNEVVQ